MKKLMPFIRLMRLDKPIGILLLLYPTVWALLIASSGQFEPKIYLIFFAGVVLMRSAGCVINDIADRNFDGLVKRTKQRPLAQGEIRVKEALMLFVLLLILAFILVLQLNSETIALSVLAVIIASLYPFMKRITHLPQLVLALAFSMPIPMAFTALMSHHYASLMLLVIANVAWTIAYDTQYAMVDRDDDVKIGVKSTAILFAERDWLIIMVLQSIALGCLLVLGFVEKMKISYFIALMLVALLFAAQARMLKAGERMAYFRAFLHNNYVGAIITLAIFSNFL